MKNDQKGAVAIIFVPSFGTCDIVDVGEMQTL